MKRAFATAAMVLALAPAVPAGAAQWAVDPDAPGPDLPPAGRSLFDFVAADGVPFPFEALVRKVERRIGCAPGVCTRAVLIPLGRSLQRMAAAPDFFDHPRAVVAVTGEGAGPMFARDRLYLGYQERAGIVEVISYNESAGRFEFQLVKDYRAGGRPEVRYAARSVCVACHQNQAPLFSRPVWDETNANAEVADRLAARQPQFYGIPVRRGVDFPNAIDDATERANAIGAIQRIWRDGCDARCRADALDAVWRYRRSNERELDDSRLRASLAEGFRARWPEGLAISNPDVPNRDPFVHRSAERGPGEAHVPAAFEALAPRGPIEIWQADDPTLPRRFVSGLAAMLATSDLRATSRDGAAADASSLGEVFTRAGALIAVGAPRPACCDDAKRLAPPRVDAPESIQPPPTEAAPFVAHCAACHATPEPSPPNFLSGGADRVRASLRSCAERIFVRLSMWHTPAADREKVPMPPPRAARDGRPWIQTTPDPELLALRDTVAGWLHAESGALPDAARLAARYETLRPCLPPAGATP